MQEAYVMTAYMQLPMWLWVLIAGTVTMLAVSLWLLYKIGEDTDEMSQILDDFYNGPIQFEELDNGDDDGDWPSDQEYMGEELQTLRDQLENNRQRLANFRAEVTGEVPDTEKGYTYPK